MKTRQTAIYARQSVDKKESLSIEGQIEQCEKSLSGESALIYTDKGFSGKNTDRPDLQRLITDIKLGKIDKVIVYKLDRISRNITDFYKLYEIMEQNKCGFLSASEAFETSSAMGKAMMGILAIFAQMERESIQKRVKDNYYYRIAQTGCWAGGPAPYGFKNGRNSENKPTLIPLENEIEAVKWMFALYSGIEHCTLGQVAKNLNRRGYKPHKRNVFDSVTVSKILQNPIYVNADKLLYSYFKRRGIRFLNEENDWDGTHTAHIVGKKVGNANIRSYTDMKEQSVYLTNFSGFIKSAHYIAVQEQLAENQQFTRNNTAGVLEELGGKLKCAKCGYAIKSYSQSTNGRPYIDCYGNRSLHTCDRKINKVNFFDLQEKIGEEIQKRLDELNDIWKERRDKTLQLSDKIIAKRKEVDNLVRISAKGETEERATERVLKETQTELDDLEYEYRKVAASSGLLEISLLHNTTLHDNMDNGIKYIDLTKEQKREVVQILIDRINLTEDINTFEIVWKI